GKEALGAKEPTLGDFWKPGCTQRFRKLSTHGLARIGMIDRPVALAAAGLVITGQNGDALEQGGFAGAVFTGNDGNGSIETQLELIVQERQAERIGLAAGNARRIEPDP